MKKSLLSFIVALLTSLSSVAQLSEGHVNYKIDISTDNPEMESALSMMQGSSLELYFKDNKTRSEMSMGAIMTITTVSDSESEELLMLVGGMMGEKGIKTSVTALDGKEEEKPHYDVAFIDETKTIVGYECKKAILTTEDGVDAVFWYTTDIEVNKKGQNYLNEEIPGFPMEFEIIQGEMKMNLRATAFNKSIGKKSKELFAMEIPDGYEEITIEQLSTLGM